MKAKNTNRMYFLIGTLLLLSQVLWPQQEADSSLAYARKQVYENPDKSIEIAIGLLNATKPTTDFKVRALIVLSTAYSSKREYEKSLEYSLNALDLLPKIKDVQLKIYLLNRIGIRYQELKIYDKAIAYLDEAYKLMEPLPDNTFKAESIGFNNLARGFIYREQMSCEIALNYFDSAIESYKKVLTNPIYNANVSTAYYNRGNCLITIGRAKDAKDSFLLAIEYAEKTNAKSLIAFAQKGLASVYTAKGQNKNAIALLTNALQNSEEVGDKVLNRAVYNALANNYLAVTDLENYSLFHGKWQSINGEIIKTERKTIDNSIKNLIHENSKKVEVFQTRINLYLTSITILILLVIVFTLRLIFSSEKTLKSLKMELKI